MFGEHGPATKATAKALYSVLLVLTCTGLLAVQVVAFLRLRSLNAVVADLIARLLSAYPVEEPSLTFLSPAPKPPPVEPERTPAEREAIHALARTKAGTDRASGNAFFTIVQHPAP